jgi:cytochrome P450
MQNAQPDISNFDPFGAEFRANPTAFHPLLAASSPGRMTLDGVDSAYVASHADVAATLRDYRRFQSARPVGLRGLERIDIFNGQPVMQYSDPPDHFRRRAVVNGMFTPRRVEKLNAVAEAIIAELLEKVSTVGEFDAMQEIAKPLTYRLMLQSFLGVEPEDFGVFQDFSAATRLLDKLRPGDPKPKPYLDAWGRGEAYCREAIARSKADEGDSLISVVANAGADGALSDAEMMAMVVLMFTASAGTISGGAAAGFLNLARYPAVAERVREEPDTAKLLLEESLRLASPITLMLRFAAEDTELGGRPIAALTPVYVMVASANRDPEKFPNPDSLDINRPNLMTHLAFGHGIHTCLGNAIARSVLPIVLRATAKRFPKLRMAPREDALVYETLPRNRNIQKLVLSI